MSMRVKLVTNSVTALFVFLVLCILLSFILFFASCEPELRDALRLNMGSIAASYFPLAGLLTLLLTGLGIVWLSAVSSVSVIEPMRKIRRAANEIRDGNLDYELVVRGSDEFSELALCFEQMRVRLKNSTREAKLAENERAAMIASVCHDLKTPITSILGYAEGILDGVADTPERIKSYAGVISKKAQSLRNLADDLSLLSSLENARLTLDTRPTDIGAMIGELFNEFISENRQVTATTQIEHGLTALADKERFTRVIINLLENSVKYARPDTTPDIGLRVAKQGADALITITDNGPGIPQDELPHVFERFYRADKSRGLSPGSGLGLSIARQIVNLHGGKIWLRSQREQGVSVSILLPLRGDEHGKNIDN